MAASLGNLCNNMAYGVLFGFFPLNAVTLGLNEMVRRFYHRFLLERYNTAAINADK